jgi:exopolysaccharide biosynthesis polyprenyl glycosylphosphotransferase
MYTSRKRRFDWALALGFSDACAFAAALPLASIPASIWGATQWQIPVWYELVIFLICQLRMLQIQGGYQWNTFMLGRSVWKQIPLSIFLGTIFFMGAIYLFRLPVSAGLRDFVTAHAISFFIILMLFRSISRWLIFDLLKLAYFERLALINLNPRLHRVAEGLQREMGNNLEIVGILSTDPKAKGTLSEGGREYKVLGSLDEIDSLIEQHQIGLFLADADTMEPEESHLFFDGASRNQVGVRMIPSSFEVWASRVQIRPIAGIPVLGVSVIHFDKTHHLITKRLLDIVGSIVGLIFSAPILAACAFLVYRESPGPVIYKQVRMGRKNKPFTIYKLRSMKLDAEKGTQPGWTVENDPRRLKIGAFLRKWNLDELPQFWNVLKGEMSLVGPRPERPEYVKDLQHDIRHYNLRMIAKPGVTGWAAIHGLRGNTSLVDRLDYDLYYIENWSALLDFKIMILTLFPPKNAY